MPINIKCIIPFLLIVLQGIAFAGQQSVPEEILKSYQLKYNSFKTIKSFNSIQVTVKGDAERSGLNQERLTDLLRLHFKNTMAGFPYQEIKNEEWQIFAKDASRFPVTGKIRLRVWVVGTGYPLVLHMSFRAGSYDNEGLYVEEGLGVTSAHSISQTVSDGIREMIEIFALIFFKVRGEL
ncbi:MAG: hypothetical protein MRJ65_07770 [Candidatus Brocadiaceae bacterium]|nr:hypothetical protein [Candidatus Brocadiaceae bacterium]